MINMDEWNNIIINDNIDNYLRTIFDEDEFNKVKDEKRSMLRDENITFTKNSDIFIKFLLQHNFNFCVVTNTRKETVELFKQKLPLLNEIQQWVYREHYNSPKPNGDCYEFAKQKYYKNEKYILGFEDSMVGYKALVNHADVIYMFNNEQIFKSNDCYLFNDFRQIS